MKKEVFLLLLLTVPLLGQPKKIVVTGMSAAEMEELRKASPMVNIVALPPGGQQDRAALLKEVADADAFIGGPSREIILAAKKLKWVQIRSAGVEAYRFPELINSDIVVTNGRGLASPAIADHAMAFLLALTRQTKQFIRAVDREEWSRGPNRLLELTGKVAVVVGVGNIGTQVAQRAHAFGMTVIGVDPKEIPPSPVVKRIVYPDRLDEVIPQADVIFVCAPATPQSNGMIGVKQFELMKQGSYFIAVSRGTLYDTNALVAALRSGKLAGAGVDVTNPEPLPKGHPLWKFDNVLITPHIATETQFEPARRMELLKENVARFARGEQLRNVVDKQKGY